MTAIRRIVACMFLGVLGLSAAPADAQNDAEGCKAYPLFIGLPNFHIADCESSQAQLKRFPVGPPTYAGNRTALEEVRGPYFRMHYVLNDGAPKPGATQTMRDLEDATRRVGGTVVGEYPDACKAVLDDSMRNGSNCINFGFTAKFTPPGKEVWAFMASTNEGAGYEQRFVEREARKQEAVANEMLEKMIKEGFVTVHINFDFGKASIKQESIPIIVQIVEMLKLAPDLNIEVAGHTDNIGYEKANQALSGERALSVVKTLIDCGVPASRLTATGYGQSKPIADNRTPEGRAMNRRVELIKR